MEQVPPEVVVQILIAAIDFPFPEHVEGEMVEQENPTRSVARGRAERAHEDAIRAAMHGVRPRIWRRAAPPRLDRADDLRLARIGFDIDHINPRRTDAGHNEITPFDMWVRRRGTKAPRCMRSSRNDAARRPLRARASPDLLAVFGRTGIEVDDEKSVRF